MAVKSRNWPVVLCLLALMVALFSPILFTDKIVRAPDILNEFYWGVYNAFGKSLWSLLRIDLSSAGWNPYINSGYTNDGAMASMQFLYPYRLIFGLIPAPASVAWFMVLHLFAGGVGTYCYCRLVGCSRLGALFGAVVFALCTENVSLINAGHVMKIATIAYAPWVFYFLERGFRSERLFHYLCAGMVLAFQFFNTHWQIAYDTCLAVGLYVFLRLMAGAVAGEGWRPQGRTVALSLLMVLFFLTAAAISLAPLASWSQNTNRGGQSGANQGKGGLDRDEAMMWSLPPEETASLVIPGLFGLSRQEAGDQPAPGQVYYWGRMVFTQTASYFGLLPWLLLPLPLLFRRDRITIAALVAVAGGLLFSMGKYTPLYPLLYDYLPGINRFRVPKMMLFITAFGLAVLTARGVDSLRDDETPADPRLQYWLYWLCSFPLVLVLLLWIERLFGATVREWLMALLSRPTRYQQGVQLVADRWGNLERETGIALAFASAYALVLLAMVRRRGLVVIGSLFLLALVVADLWRVDRQFLVLTKAPERQGVVAQTPAMEWIRTQERAVAAAGVPQDRVLLLGGGDPMQYASAGIPVLFTANAVQKRRWQEYLDALTLQSALPSLMNVRWLVADQHLYARAGAAFGAAYRPVFTGGGEVVLENRQALPKAWLVDRVTVVPNPAQCLRLLQDPAFRPRERALVETPPPFPLQGGVASGEVQLQRFEAERIDLTTRTSVNSLLLLGEKYQQGWRATVDGRPVAIIPADHILRGLYLTPGLHRVEFRFDPAPFKIGRGLTLCSFALFALFAFREWFLRKRNADGLP